LRPEGLFRPLVFLSASALSLSPKLTSPRLDAVLIPVSSVCFFSARPLDQVIVWNSPPNGIIAVGLTVPNLRTS